MKKKYNKLLAISFFIIMQIPVMHMPVMAGVYNGATDDATFTQLLLDVAVKSQQLDEKVAQAKSLGLNTDYAQVSQVTIKLFKDTFAPWDKANLSQVQAMYDAKYFSRHDPVGAKGLPFDELADCIEVADTAIEELQQQIDGEISLTTPPDFDSGQLVLNGSDYELNGNKVIAGKFFWQPNDKEIMRAFGYGGERYLAVQDLATINTIKPYRKSNFIQSIKEQQLNNRTPLQFFLGHIVPQNSWLRTETPEAFSKGSRLFTDYDIDNPNVKNWFSTLFSEQLSPGVEELGDTERVYMIANEPTFSIREGGVNADRGVSQNTLTKYTQWLTNKYGTISVLNTTYNSNFSTFSDVKNTYTIPLKLSYQGGPIWYDWNRFNMDRVNEWFTYLHNSVHSVDDKARTHIKVMGERSIFTPYQDEGMDFEFILKLVDMPGSDNQSSSLAAEWDVRHNLNWQERYSLEWRAQTMMLDFHKSIAPEKHFYDSEWHGLSGARWRDFHMSSEYVKSTLWLAATHGLGSLTSWVWNRLEDGSIDTRADFIGTSVTQPIQLDAYGRTLKELNAHGNKIAALVPEKRAYLLYYNKDAAIQDPLYTGKLADVYEALKLLNVPVGFTTPSELGKVAKDTQTIIISPTSYISDIDLAVLSSFVDDNGKVILFDKETSFIKSELGIGRVNSSPFSAMASLPLADVLTMADALKTALTDRAPQQSITLTVNNSNNESVYGVISSQFVEANSGKTIVSLINTSQQSRMVSLSSEFGSPTDIVNVVNQQAQSASFSMKPMDVLLLSIEPTSNNLKPVTGIDISSATLSLVAGNSSQLRASIYPSDASNKAVVWRSDNESVATVSSQGNVTAIKAGSAIITLASQEGDFSKTTVITVTKNTQENVKAAESSGGGSLSFSILFMMILCVLRKKYV
jgi:hypothetical protein